MGWGKCYCCGTVSEDVGKISNAREGKAGSGRCLLHHEQQQAGLAGPGTWIVT
jgi:hypothetical protein